MKINIKATGIELTPDISAYAEKIVSTLDRLLGGKDAVAQVELGKTTHHHEKGEVYKAEVHLIGDGLDMYAVSEKEDLRSAIDDVKDEIATELKKMKGKRFALMRRGGLAVKNMMRGIYTGVKGFRVKRWRREVEEE